MKNLPPTRLTDYDEVYCRVSSGSAIRVKKVSYSVPARLIGQHVKVEVYENELKVFSGRELLLSLTRRHSDRGLVLDYRHVIDHLLRKPGAFERYRYREQLFPAPIFRRAYDYLLSQQGHRRGVLEYLQLLKLTSQVRQNDVELMLIDFLSPPGAVWTVEQIRQALLRPLQPALQLLEFKPECQSYDALLTGRKEVVYAG